MTPDLATCEWRGGESRYTGSVASAITAYGLPLATQTALIEAWERRQFTDVVVIDRDSIKGKAGDYADLRDMHFGSRGRRCATVTRAGWSANHVETAIVLCAGSECIAVPSICLNVARITRTPPAAARPDDAADIDAVVAVVDPEPLTIAGPQTTALEDSPTSSTGSDGPAFRPGWTYTPPSFSGGGYPACHGVVPAVPEPGVWALLLAGLAAVGAVAWTKSR